MLLRQVLLSLVLALVAGAQEPERRSVWITFQTDPPGAQVFVNQHYVGLSGQRLSLDLDPEGIVVMDFKLAGYRSHSEQTLAGMLLSSREGVFPLDGSRRSLTPASPLVLARRYAPWLGLGGVLATGALWVVLRQAQQVRRARQVEAMLAEAPADASRVARQLGGYLLVDLLGGGGMAQVYRGIPAASLDATKAVAIKILHRSLASDEDQKRRFEREIDVCRQLNHPNVVHVLDWGIQEDGRTYLLMELVEGGTLRARLRPEGLDGEQARQVLEPIFAAVSYAHRKGIVHRDLKPENILLTARGLPKVSDFGLARALDSETLTETGTALGTPAYMAPEQVAGQRVGPAADQYSLGVLAYELLTGRKPFENADPIQLIFMHISENPPPPSSLKPTLSPQTDAVLLRMLAKDPQARFPDLDEAWHHLAVALA